MILKKEIIEKAVNWWVEKVTANQPHSNGDNGYTSIVTCLLADSRTKKISKKQTDVFKKALSREIEEEAKKRTRFSICCDYGPCKVLFVAAHEAGLSMKRTAWWFVMDTAHRRSKFEVAAWARKIMPRQKLKPSLLR